MPFRPFVYFVSFVFRLFPVNYREAVFLFYQFNGGRLRSLIIVVR